MDRIFLIVVQQNPGLSILTELEQHITPEIVSIFWEFNCPWTTIVERFFSHLGFKQTVLVPAHRDGTKLDLCFFRH